ncbi:MAG: hypothetical protein RL708_2153 [Bacteroidota bacterium]|jgi:Na+/H+-dicarboxylate symporter
MKKNRLTIFIFAAMIIGIIVGAVIHSNNTIDGKTNVAFYTDNISVLTKIFLNLIKMIIGPLVFASLVAGVAKLGDVKVVGRIGGKTLAWFLFATLISLSLGMLLVNFFQPGAGMPNVPMPVDAAKTTAAATSINFTDFVSHIFPTSIFKALAENEILEIIVFAIFFGMACAAMPDVSKPIIKALDAVTHIMLKVTTFVMNLAPIAVFAAISGTIAQNGLEVLVTFGKLIGEFYLGLILLWIILVTLGFLFTGKKIFQLISGIKDAVLLAFSTSSSESAFPKLIEELERFGCSNKIVSFVLPLGYSFNLDGSMMYMTFASLFIAQCYHIQLSFAQQLSMLLILMVTSKGIAGVPRASLVVISGALATFHIPEAGLLLLMGIDQLLDMGRSATNVLGNAVATTVISKWENELR